jgi:hypothetical protein
MPTGGIVAGVEGTEQYRVDADRLLAAGASFDENGLTSILRERVLEVLADTAGRAEVGTFLAELPETSFGQERLEAILKEPPTLEPWRICEALAEVFLVDARECNFPWPAGRDLKNPKSSPAGADLVGFTQDDAGDRFAFGEVKTSSAEDTPPSLMFGRSGLISQLEVLRDDETVKGHLVLYLAFRASHASWIDAFQASARRYLADPTDVALFGVLVRDVPPNELDLKSRAAALAKGQPTSASVELRAKYLPIGTIAGLTNRLADLQSDASNN